MAEKRYFWLKLKKDFFKRHDIAVVEAMPNGKDYVLFYLKLLAESIDHTGHLRFNETIPYNAAMLATITNTNVDIVKSACDLFVNLSLMEKLDDGTLFMTESNSMIGSEGKSAERVRAYRDRQKALPRNIDVTKSNTIIELELDKELDIKLETEKKPKRTSFVKPSKVEILEYITDKQLSLDVDAFIDHYESNGWKVGRNAMKDWKATVRNWARKGNSFNKPQQERNSREGISQWLEKEGEL